MCNYKVRWTDMVMNAQTHGYGTILRVTDSEQFEELHAAGQQWSCPVYLGVQYKVYMGICLHIVIGFRTTVLVLATFVEFPPSLKLMVGGQWNGVGTALLRNNLVMPFLTMLPSQANW